MLHIITLILVACVTYAVCLMEHRRVVRKMNQDFAALTPRLKTEGMYELMQSPKLLRETLCVAQACIGSELGSYSTSAHHWRLQALINQIDVFRPIGPDGKHGSRHTDWCGCDDK